MGSGNEKKYVASPCPIYHLLSKPDQLSKHKTLGIICGSSGSFHAGHCWSQLCHFIYSLLSLASLSWLVNQCRFMHMRLNKAKLRTCCTEMRTLLNLAQGCMSVVIGDVWVGVRQLEIHVRAAVGNCGGYSGELIRKYCLTTTMRGHSCLKFVKQYHCPSWFFTVDIITCQFSTYRPTLDHTQWSSWWRRASASSAPWRWWSSVLPCRADGGVRMMGLFSWWCVWYSFHSFFRWTRSGGAAARWWSRARAPPAGSKHIKNI